MYNDGKSMDIRKILYRHYLGINIPGIVVFLFIYTTDQTWAVLRPNHLPIPEGQWITITLLLMQALFAIIVPLWYRIHFVQRTKGEKNVSRARFIHFEKKFLSLACPNVYLLLLGYLSCPSRATFAAMILFAFYSLYFYFPSHKRVRAEQKIFRVKG
jgi:hypothetical protein